MSAILLTGVLFLVMVAATAWVVASDLVREVLDRADPVAAFAVELQDEVNVRLAQDDPGWASGRAHFARWERELST